MCEIKHSNVQSRSVLWGTLQNARHAAWCWAACQRYFRSGVIINDAVNSLIFTESSYHYFMIMKTLVNFRFPNS